MNIGGCSHNFSQEQPYPSLIQCKKPIPSPITKFAENERFLSFYCQFYCIVNRLSLNMQPLYPAYSILWS